MIEGEVMAYVEIIYVGVIERSMGQMLFKNALTTIEIDGAVHTQKSRERNNYKVTEGNHTIKCYEGDINNKKGTNKKIVEFESGYSYEIKYTASQLPIMVAGEIKIKKKKYKGIQGI